jgi:hypothetical protein
MLSKKSCQQHYQNIVILPQNLSLHSCVFHYLGIHDAIPLVDFSFNEPDRARFQTFRKYFFFFLPK